MFHILLALADEDRHGYGIIKEVESRTEGRIRLMAGTLYGAISRLEVLSDGKVSIPLVQDVQAEGLTAGELADVIL